MGQCYGAEENLDEMFNRKSRRLTNSFPASELEDIGNHYIWQPETLMYHDIQTGHEVWKMSDSKDYSNTFYSDIGEGPWSADGKRLGFTSYARPTSAYQGEESWYIWMMNDTDGKNLRPAIGSVRRLGPNFPRWSPQISDVYYEVGETHLFPWAERPDDKKLYKCQVLDNSINCSDLFSFPVSGINLNKFISSDGRKIIGLQWTGETTPPKMYPAKIYPENRAELNLADGYPEERYLGNYGNTINPLLRYHDAYYSGDGSWYFAMPTGTATWWRLKTLGSAPDGGPLYSGDSEDPSDQPPYNFGEAWPENHGDITVSGNAVSPFVQDDPYTPLRTSYWSHFVPDRWGRFALFSNGASNLPGSGSYSYRDRVGAGVWDIQNHQYSVPSFGGGSQHHDWHGFTDWVTSSSPWGLDLTGSYLDDRIYAAKYKDASSRISVCYTHTRYNGGTSYNSLTRPGQSPDGTKVAWHSEFLNPSANKTDIFWSVVTYPYPPTDLSAQYDSGVEISWLPPKYTERDWPYANDNPAKDALGWPLLDESGNELGETLYAREIKKYHIWRSTSQSSGWQEIGMTDAQYSHTYAEDPDMLMLHPIANGLKVNANNKISFTDNPGNGTFYYALTSEEHSGLESDELSEILQVTINGASVDSQVVAGKGQKNFWTNDPNLPNSFNYVSQPTAGHYRLSWNEPNDSKVRHYNIYYSTSGNPTATQTQRIASPPAGTATYLDWLADPNGDGYYGITSVDRYGNESSIVVLGGDINPPALPVGLVVR